ncbi:MAG: hypothetical protein D6737_04310 [Chloroflexi bacterium]|nr:MAG: hypothetical protein D6737_04310 [Chloroflexota bacterium]
MAIRFFAFLLVFVIFSAFANSNAQDNRSVLTQTSQLTRRIDQSHSSDIAWTEIVETQNADQSFREVVIVNVGISRNGIVSESCSHARQDVDGSLTYNIDGELQVVDSAESLWSAVDVQRQSSLELMSVVDGLNCVSGDSRCTFNGIGVPPITSISDQPGSAFGEVVVQNNLSTPIHYDMTITSQNIQITDQFDRIQTDGNAIIAQSEDVQLLCMNNALPLPPETSVISNGEPSNVLLRTPLSIEEAREFFGQAFQADDADWSIGRIILPTQQFMTHERLQCQATIEYATTSNGMTTVDISIAPELVPMVAEDIATPGGPVVGLSLPDGTSREAGNIDQVFEKALTDFAKQGWTPRPELSAQGSDWRFGVLSRDNIELYVIVNAADASTSWLTFDHREATCQNSRMR